MTDSRIGEHAIVIGCSLAGMSHAAVLRHFFDRVTILEADHLDLEKAVPRPGVPQGQQLHGLLNRGLTNLDRFLPGLKDDLLRSGASPGEFGRNVYWFMNGTWWSQVPSGIGGLGFTRPHFEFVLRRRLLREKNVVLRDETTVANFLTNDDLAKVTGVQLKSNGQATERLEADLVVDCTGRYSKTLKDLEKNGVSVPSQEVEVDLHYLTQLVRFEQNPKWTTLYVTAAPPHNKRQALIMPVEGNRYIMCWGGFFGDVPPRDRQSVERYLYTLESPALAKIFPRIIPVSEAVPYRFKSNFRRYFSKAKGFPNGLIFSGDVVCSFNPIYGQGMTTASISADVMRACLERRQKRGLGLDGLSAEFHKAQDRVMDQSWMQVLTNDMRYPETEGQRTVFMRLMISYMRLLFSAMHLRYVHDRVVPIFNMMVNPVMIFHPVLLATVLLVKLGLIRPQPDIPQAVRAEFATEADRVKYGKNVKEVPAAPERQI